MHRFIASTRSRVFAASTVAVIGRATMGFGTTSHAEARVLAPDERALGAVVGGITADAAAMVSITLHLY